MTNKVAVYFSHGKSQYNTLREAAVIDELKLWFPSAVIINPANYPPAKISSQQVKKFLNNDSCSNCNKYNKCRIDYYLDMIYKVDLFVRWHEGARCGVECETRFARFIGKPIYTFGRWVRGVGA